MAASSQFSQSKRARDENSIGVLALPNAKRTNCRRLAHDGDLIDLLEKIDNMDAINSNPVGTHTVIQPGSEKRFNGVIKSLEDEIGLEAQMDYKIKSTDENCSTDQMAGSNKVRELIAGRNFEATSVTSPIGDFTFYDNVCEQFDFFVEDITPNEFGFIMENYLDPESVLDIIYSDLTHVYVENTEFSYGSLWEDDIWQLNEQPITQNDSKPPQQKEFGSSGSDFHDVMK